METIPSCDSVRETVAWWRNRIACQNVDHWNKKGKSQPNNTEHRSHECWVAWNGSCLKAPMTKSPHWCWWTISVVRSWYKMCRWLTFIVSILCHSPWPWWKWLFNLLWLYDEMVCIYMIVTNNQFDANHLGSPGSTPLWLFDTCPIQSIMVTTLCKKAYFSVPQKFNSTMHSGKPLCFWCKVPTLQVATGDLNDDDHTFEWSIKVKVTLIHIMADIVLQCEHVDYLVAWAFTRLYFGIWTWQHHCTLIKLAPSTSITPGHNALSLPRKRWPYNIHKAIFIMQDME